MPSPGQFIPKQFIQLIDVSALSPVADRLVYFTSASALGLATLTAFGRSLIDDAAASDARTTLSLGTAAVVNTGTSGATIGLLSTANAWSAKQTITPAADAQDVLRININSGNAGFQFGSHPSSVTYSGFWAGNITPDASNYTFLGNGTSETIFNVVTGGVLVFRVNNATSMMMGAAEFRLGSAMNIAFSSTANPSSAVADVAFFRSAVGLMAVSDSNQTGNPGLAFQARSSTTNLQDRFRLTTAAISNVHAARQYSAALDVYNFNGACRVISMSAPASGTAAKIGFLGADDVVRQTVAVAASDAATTQTLVNDLRTALINLGLAV